MLDHIGESFDRYQIEGSIRQDIWGTVYRAYDPKFARKVAIQFLGSELSRQAKTVESYLQLARTVLRWRHPGIIRFFDFGESQEKVYTVQEYFPGPDLEEALQKLRSRQLWLPLSESIQIVNSVCQALHYAHQRGVKHQNLTAKNILLNSEPGDNLPFQPVLINLGFGLAEQNENSESDEGVVQDIQAAGKLLFHLVCGTPLLQEKDNPAENIVDSEIASQMRNSRPELPHSLERVILQALAAGSQAGYQNIQDLGLALKQSLPVAVRMTAAPAGFEDNLSLSAIIRDFGKEKPASELDPNSASKPVAEDEPQANGDNIHILLPDQTVRSIPFRGKQMTIGRGSENDIVLDETGVSRRHAKFDYDGQQYQVTDLKSTNGVFIDEFRLLPETPHPWLPGENLRIGESWLRIEKAEQELNTVAIPSVQATRKIVKEAPQAPVPPVEETQERPRLDANPISAFTIDSNLTVTPGKSVSAPVVLYNRSTKADVYYLELQGIPGEWTPNRPQSVNIPANGQKEITLVFRPPRAYTSRAGRHSIILRITSQNEPSQVLELRLSLTISAFSQFSSELQPKQLKSGDMGTLVLRNLGNIPETFTLSWEDRAGELAFDPKRANATVPPGETVKVPYQVSRAQTLWFGSEKVNSFKVNISSQSAQTQSHTGSFYSKALIPPWALIALISLCLVLSCVLIIFTNQLLGTGPNARATDRATQTVGAIVNQQTAQAITATASSILSANQATIQAITATAVWRDADDDGDGLTNGQEILLNTRPDLKDTDEDGLSDGDEVNLYRTNPIVADSDGDGLKDGEEIQRRTDPLRRDTDGDGLEDAVDPDPLSTSTPTQQATTTLTPTTTASATPTITPTATYPPNIANLSLTLTNNTTTSIPGANTAYTLQVRNNSPITVNNIQVIDAFPSILLNVTWNCVASAGSACQLASGLGNIDTRISLAPVRYRHLHHQCNHFAHSHRSPD